MTYQNICRITVITALIVFSVLLRKKKTRFKLLYFSVAMIPFLVENSYIPYSNLISKILVFAGIIIYLRGNQRILIEMNSFSFLLVSVISSTLSSGINQVEFYALVNLVYQIFLAQIIYNIVWKEKSVDLLLDIFRYSSLIISISAIIEFFFIGGRVTSVFYNPNFMSVYISIGAISFLTSKRKFYYLGLVIVSLAIIFSGSYSILLALAGVLLITIIEQGVNKTNRLLLFAFIGVGASIILIMLRTVGFAFQEGPISDILNLVLSRKDNYRKYIWQAAIDIFLSNPLIGVGYGNFISAMTLVVEFSPILNIGGMYSHNDYLRVLSELGIIGFLTFILFLFNQIRKIILARPTPTQRMVGYSWLIMLIFLTTHNYLTVNLIWIIFSLPSVLSSLPSAQSFN